MKHDYLNERGVKWLKGAGKCKFAISEMWCAGSGETPDCIGWDYYNSTLIESKTSRSDFKADAKKLFRRHPEKGVGTKRYYLTPPGLVKLSEVPEGWGLLEVHGRVIKVLRKSNLNFSDEVKRKIKITERYMLLSMLNRFSLSLGKDFEKTLKDIDWNPSLSKRVDKHYIKQLKEDYMGPI